MEPEERAETVDLARLARYRAAWQHLKAAALLMREVQAECQPPQMAQLLSRYGQPAEGNIYDLARLLIWCQDVAGAQQIGRLQPGAGTEEWPHLPDWPSPP
jgi:hypothetical protein